MREPSIGALVTRGAALLGLLAGLGGCTPRQPADLILHNGKVLTVDDSFSVRQSAVIRDGKVLAVGGEELVRRFQAPRVIDLGGRLALPGFNDTHTHLEGHARRWIDLAGTRSLADLRRRVEAKAAELGPGEWITGYGWAEDELAEQRRPLRADLDPWAPGNPVILTRAGGHSAVANSRALALAGITRTTRDPPNGTIEREPNGNPNGIIRERWDLVARLVPPSRPEELRASFLAELRKQLSFGITSFILAGSTIEEFREWQAVYREHGDSLPRAAVQIYWAGPDSMKAFGMKTGDGDARLRIGAVKVLVDGGFTGPAAYTLKPYKGQPHYYGKLNYTPEQLYALVKTGHALGWQLGFHTIGDGAIKLTVDIFDRVLQESPRPDHRHYLNHFTVLPPEETLATMARDSILVAQQPNFTYTLDGRYSAYLEGERLERNNPLRTVLRHGIFLALGADILPTGPMVGLYAAVTRKGRSGVVFGADERLTMPEAITGYTRNGAYVTREEKTKGTLEPGMLADIVVLDQDLLTIDPEQILGVKVDLTIVGGKVVYERTGVR